MPCIIEAAYAGTAISVHLRRVAAWRHERKAVETYVFTSELIKDRPNNRNSWHVLIIIGAHAGEGGKRAQPRDGNLLQLDAVMGPPRVTGYRGQVAIPHSDGVNGVRSGRPQASMRDSHGIFCLQSTCRWN